MRKIIILTMLLFLLSNVAYAGKRYNDVPEDAWYSKSVERVSGIMDGDGDNFHPDDTMTRAELADVVSKMIDKIDQQDKHIKALQTPSSESLSESVNKTIHSVVRIETPLGVGSGFFISSDLIVSSAHQFGEDRSYIKIKLDSKEYQGKLIKLDQLSDLSLIKIDSKVGTPLTVAQSSSIGETLFTIGFPLDIGISVAKGILSAKNRPTQMIKIDNSYQLPFFDQVDMNVNFGNSGGPVMNHNGEVIGVIHSTNDNAIGIGYITRLADMQKFINGVHL